VFPRHTAVEHFGFEKYDCPPAPYEDILVHLIQVCVGTAFCWWEIKTRYIRTVAYRGGGGLGGFNPPPLKFRMPTPQNVRKKGSKVLKLPSVRNCFTLAMTNKLVVITNSLKVPKIKKILLYEMKFLVPNYSYSLNPWLGGYRPQTPVLSVLCPQMNLLNTPTPNPHTKFLGTPLHSDTNIMNLLFRSGIDSKLFVFTKQSFSNFFVCIFCPVY